MLFIGVHVAPTATIAVFEGDEFAAHVKELVHVPKKDVVNKIGELIGEGAVFVALDTPLIMKKSHRHVEELLELLFNQYHVKRKLPTTAKDGERLVKQLAELHVVHDPHIKNFERSRKCFEVSPAHASVIFGKLSRAVHHDTIDVKAYQKLVNILDKLHLPSGMLAVDHEELSKKERVKYEAELDAVVAAYVAYHAWHFPKKCEVLGNMREGYVLIPGFERANQ